MDPAGDLIQVPDSSSAALRRPILRHSSITVRIAVSGRATGSSGYAGVLRTWVCRGLRSQNRSRQGAYRLEASYSGQPVAVRASCRANPKIAVTPRCPDTMIALRICDWGGESGGHPRRSPTAAQSVLSRTSIPDNEAPASGPETPRRLHLRLAVLGTDLGTEQGETDANTRDVWNRLDGWSFRSRFGVLPVSEGGMIDATSDTLGSLPHRRSAMTDTALVVGEALIDIVQHEGQALGEHVGGSPLNVAVGLALLGSPRRVPDVDRRRPPRPADSRLPSRHRRGPGRRQRRGIPNRHRAWRNWMKKASATYQFDIEWQVSPNPRRRPPLVLHTGSIATALEPGCDGVAELIDAHAATSTISSTPTSVRVLRGRRRGPVARGGRRRPLRRGEGQRRGHALARPALVAGGVGCALAGAGPVRSSPSRSVPMARIAICAAANNGSRHIPPR